MVSRGRCAVQKTILALGMLALLNGAVEQLCSQVQTDALYGPYLGQEPPGIEPRVFAPEGLRSTPEWWWHGALAYTPDGRELYMDIYYADQGIRLRSLEMSPEDGLWSVPQSPSFAGSFTAASPSFTPDGSRVFFISDRPSGFIWVSTRTADGWSAPQAIRFPAPASLGFGWRASVAADESLFMQMVDSTLNTDFDIYRIRRIGGAYVQPERLDDNVNSPFMDLGAFIDPGGSYLVFESSRPGGYGRTDLYISFSRQDGSWSPALNMGEPVNSSAMDGSPFVSADGRYLFFLSDRVPAHGMVPYWVDWQAVLDRLMPDGSDLPQPRRPAGRIAPADHRSR